MGPPSYMRSVVDRNVVITNYEHSSVSVCGAVGRDVLCCRSRVTT